MNITKSIKTFIFSGIMGLLISSVCYADAPHSVTALEHAVTAEAHNKLGHTNDVKNHIDQAIKHATESEKAHATAHTHVTEAVKHLQETTKQKDMQHTMSGVYTQVALTPAIPNLKP